MNASDHAAEIVDEFSFFDDWEDRYQHLIDLGRRLPPLEDRHKIEENRLRGCQSVVHFKAEYDAPVLLFHAGSDAAIVQGLIALMLRVYSGQKPEDILATQPDFLHQIGLDEHLSPTRKNGLASLVTAIMDAARRQLA
ncbi:SufE family protein [Alphaproteobacteria bacterium LSUCC0684]